MNDIEKAVQSAIEEFWELAHERFTDDCGLSLSDNDELNRLILECHDIKLKPLPELFAHDVTVYGDNAYLMYVVDNMDIDSNNHLLLLLEHNRTLTRKTSAALPFDLERAKAGDVVWHIAGGNVTDIDIPDRADYAISGVVNGISTTFYLPNLSMKYPPKITR